MDAGNYGVLESQLHDRRHRLQAAMQGPGDQNHIVRLLREVDAALDRMHAGTYGSCDVCGEEVAEADLRAYPLLRYCLCRLSPDQLDALSSDLTLAWRIQTALLPEESLRVGNWETHYRYEPVGPVSGDYCDLLDHRGDGGDLFFVVGDVSGKGVASSLLMAHLNALFRSLVGMGLPVADLVERANRLLLENTMPSHYATIVCGWARRDGAIEICNAGHCEPLVLRPERVESLGSTGSPVGLLENQRYTVITTRLDPGDTLVLYSDGLVEASNRHGEPYQVDRLRRLLETHREAPLRRLTAACLEDLAAFLGGAPRSDDLTLLALRRAGR